MTAEPQRDMAPWRQGIDAGVGDGMALALEGDKGLGPQGPHDLDLFLGAPAPILEVLIEADEFNLVPADPDAEAQAAVAQHVEGRRLFRHQGGLALAGAG